MPSVAANGLEIAYEAFGPADGEAVLLIMGWGAQLTRWPDALCEGLAKRGFRAIRFDNRDVGLSTHLHHAGVPDLRTLMTAPPGQNPAAPYTLDDMAADAIGLLDALGHARAHIVGASMGGMIAQIIAADAPARVRSLTLIMTTSQDPDLPQARPEIMAALMGPRPDPAADLEGFLAVACRNWALIGSPGFPTAPDELLASVRADFERSHDPGGIVRQFAAVATASDRHVKLATIAAPTIVVHGEDDPLVLPDCGRDLARRIPAAELRLIAGMGHDFATGLVPIFIAAISDAASRAA